MNIEIAGKAFRVPPSWGKMGFTARAGYLCSSHQAPDYRAACQILRSVPRGPRRKPAAVYTPSTRTVRLPYADQP